jgi:hypothetical protein
MKAKSILFASLVFCAISLTSAADFVTILDASNFSQWTVKDAQGGWSFTNGVLRGTGPGSFIYSPGSKYLDFDLKCEVMTTVNANSGIYFRAEMTDTWPRGQEAQIMNTPSGDPQRTGSIYGLADCGNIIAPDNTWFTYEIIIQGKHYITKVNGTTCVDYTDIYSGNPGRFAIQQHGDATSSVYIRNLQVKDLSATSVRSIANQNTRRKAFKVELFGLNGRKCDLDQKILGQGIYVIRSTDNVTRKTVQRLFVR